MQLKSMRVGQVKLYTTGLDAGGAQPHLRRRRSRRSTQRSRTRSRRVRTARSRSFRKARMSSPSSPDARGTAEPPQRSRSISISWAASPATCSWPRSPTRCRRCSRTILDAIAAVRPDRAAMPEFAATTQAGLRAWRFGVATAYRAAPDSAGAAYTGRCAIAYATRRSPQARASTRWRSSRFLPMRKRRSTARRWRRFISTRSPTGTR